MSTKTVPTVYQKQPKDSQNSKNHRWYTNRHMSTQIPPNTQSRISSVVLVLFFHLWSSFLNSWSTWDGPASDPLTEEGTAQQTFWVTISSTVSAHLPICQLYSRRIYNLRTAPRTSATRPIGNVMFHTMMIGILHSTHSCVAQLK